MKKLLITMLAAAMCLPVFSLPSSAKTTGSVKTTERNYRTIRSISYRPATLPGGSKEDAGKVDDYMKEMCLLDVAYEKGAENRPVIVWFHGGGLTSGHRQIPEALKRDGATIVGVEYRFVTEVGLDEVLDDCAAAVAWVVTNIGNYGGDANNIYLSGHSAGGYITDMLGLDKKWLGKYGIDPDTFAGLAPYSGQVITHFAQRKKMGVDALTPMVDNYAPLAHIRKDCPPILVLSGDRELELFGRYEESAYFVRMLLLKGHKDVTLYEFDGYGHSDMCYPGHPIFLNFIKRITPTRMK